MPRKPLANRKTEIELFRAMLNNATDTRILLVQATMGKGKSLLIRYLRHECPADRCVVHLDFKGAEIGLAGALHEFRELVGATRFARFDAAYHALRGVPNISENIAGGTMDISVVLNVDEQTRKFNLAQLNSAFFDDLRSACNNLVVIIDTFEKAPPDLQTWITGTFLPHVPRLSQLCVVVAGQKVPEATSAPWEDICERRTLDNINDVDEWMEYVHARQWKFDRPYIHGIVDALNGFPRNVVMTLEAVAPRWK
ncbi:MAG: ATP-binding protein [Chloroflexi bacterium]|nr:ATP-binding protein [Chloroflexota bacterium]